MDAFSIDQPTFGERLRRLRTQRRLSQRDLAGGVVNPSYISLIESGARVPTLDVAVRLAEILQVTLAELMGGAGEAGRDAAGVTPGASGADGDSHARGPAAPGTGPIPTRDDPAAAPVGQRVAETDRLIHDLLAEGARETGDLADARLRFRGAYDASRVHGDAVAAVESGWALLDVLGRLGDLSGRVELSGDLVTLADEIGNVEVSIRTWVDRAAALRDGGDLRGARDVIEHARSAVDGTTLAHTGEHVRLLGVAISISSEIGDLSEVAPMVSAMLDVATKVGSDAVLGRALWVAGLAYGRLGDADAASTAMSRAARILSNPATSLRDWIRFSLAAGTALLDSDGDEATVRRHLDTAHIALTLVELPAEAAVLRLQQARLAVRSGQPREAFELIDGVPLDDLDPASATVYWAVRGQVLEGADRIPDAIEALRRAVELCEQAGAYKLAAAQWREIDRLRSA